MKTAQRLCLAFVPFAIAGSVFAAGAADSISVVDPYVRLAPPAALVTGAFMVLKNVGDKEVKLVKAESSAAKTVELHNHINEGGVMKMRQVAAIEIKAKAETALKPGSYHIMLIDMKAPLKEGDKINFTLGFDDGSTKQVGAVVKNPGAAKAEMQHDQGHHKH